MNLNPNRIVDEGLGRLLAWLDPDPEAAERKYLECHRHLVQRFVLWGCLDPEGLASETLDRVSRKVDVVGPDYRGEPIAYMIGVARNIRREEYHARVRRPPRLAPAIPPPPNPEEQASEERRVACLEGCMREILRPEEERLLLDYYRTGAAGRKALAQAAGLSRSSLRKRTERFRGRLAECVARCVAAGGPPVTRGGGKP
jgi:DNA-directed RNA polymerase specialized sigma24 family protein